MGFCCARSVRDDQAERHVDCGRHGASSGSVRRLRPPASPSPVSPVAYSYECVCVCVCVCGGASEATADEGVMWHYCCAAGTCFCF